MSLTIVGRRPHWKKLVDCKGDREKLRVVMMSLEAALKQTYTNMRRKKYSMNCVIDRCIDILINYKEDQLRELFSDPFSVLDSEEEERLIEEEEAALALEGLRCHECPDWPPYTQKWQDVETDIYGDRIEDESREILASLEQEEMEDPANYNLNEEHDKMSCGICGEKRKRED